MIRAACAAVVLMAVTLHGTTVSASAQSRQMFRVQVHGGGDPILREKVVSGVTRALQPVADVEVVSRDPEYFVSVIVFQAAGGGYVMSMAVLNVHTDEALSNFAQMWGVDEATRQRMLAVFRGSGALVDQRIVTGVDLDVMCADIARALDADTLATRR